MQTLRRIVAVLIFPAIAYLGVACERADAPTASNAVPPISAAPSLGPADHWVNDNDPNGGGYAPPGTSCTNPGYPRIQDAVNAASSGDTIQVCVGMYIENDTLKKNLTLLGAQVGVDARGRADSESVVTPFIPANATLELQAGSRRSIIDGFTFFGGAFADGSGHLGAIESTGGPIDSLQILNNRIRGFTAGSGVYLNNNGINITVSQNEIDGTFKVGGGGLVHLDQDNFDGFWFTNNRVVNGVTGTGFFVDGTRNVDAGTAGARRPLFSGNFIANNGTGVNLGRGAWGDGPITGNTFSNNIGDGLQGGPKNSRISQNTFDRNGHHGLALTSFGNMNPNFSGPGTTAGAQNDTITQNCFTGNAFLVAGGAGIFFSATQFPRTISTNVVHQNNIFGNLVGARYLLAVVDTETIHAELNWWGSSTGPTHPSNLGGTGDLVVDNGPLLMGGIDFDPWRTSAAVGTPCAPPPAPPGKVTGGGQVPVDMMGGKGSFGFNAKSDGVVGSGHLNYLNHATGAHIDCTVDAVTMLTDSTAEFSGMCTSNSAANANSFSAHVEDHGNPGKGKDKFTISYGVVFNEGGTLTSGNIQIHK
jgi:hypothetical protein